MVYIKLAVKFSLVAHSYQNGRNDGEERGSNSCSRVTTTQCVICLVHGVYADTVKTSDVSYGQILKLFST